MARKLRIEYAGAIYHVMNRGDHQEPICADDVDRETFVQTLGEACVKTGWQVHAWCLMDNHFHLVVETPEPNLVAGMKWLLGTYTGRFNRRHRKVGHLFAGRYKSLVVDGSGTGYVRTVAEYVHLNPARARLVPATQPLRTYRWSSLPSYLLPPRRRPSWLRTDRVLGELGIPRDTRAGRQQCERWLEARRAVAGTESYAKLRRGWYWGDEAFRKELLAQVAERMGPHHYGEERRAGAQERAEAIIAAELAGPRWRGQPPDRSPKGDPRKVALALRLRAETTMSVAWIATRLGLGTRQYATKLLYHARRQSRTTVR
jgi:REP element-mobilizing transposase RayT